MTLKAIAAEGRLPELRWPDFSDFRTLVQRFYAPAYSLAWIRDGEPTPQAQSMIDLLEQADMEGLRTEDYDGLKWQERLAHLRETHSAADEARFDAALTVCTMRYVSAVRMGRVNPHHFKLHLDVSSKKLDLAVFVRRQLVAGEDAQAEIEKIEPQFASYQRVKAALARYMELAREDGAEKLPVPRNAVFPGSAYEGLARLTQLLKLEGDLPANAAEPEKGLYTEPLVSAVKKYQWRHGQDVDGKLDEETLGKLNTPLSRRVEQLRLALERWRWMPLTYSQPPIVVNIPEFYLRAFDAKGEPELFSRVNIGAAYEHETPVFQDRMEYIVFRPYWDVPPSIQRNEVVPDTEADRNYLKDNNFEAVDASGSVVTSGVVTDDVLSQLKAGTLRLREKPGPMNALGLVKFIFPNEHSVYLHDTPEVRELFADEQRDLSHGCVHVQDAAELAAWVLRDKPEWTLEKVKAAMQSGKNNFRVNLTKPIPVVIVYTTAVAEEDGQVFFFADVYGQDAKLEAALAKGYPYPQ